MPRQLFQRNPNNPILSAKDWPYEVHSVFNPGVTRVGDDVVLLVRCENHVGVSHLCVARSANGVDGWRIDKSPTLVPEPDKYEEELWGIEDPRITYLAEEKKWIIAYTSFSSNGPLVSLAETKDFKTFKRCGAILLPENKDAALLPERINGEWVIIHRPVCGSLAAANMWISCSPDLIHWGRHHLLAATRPGSYWDSVRIGLSAQPLKTEDGWLVLYHGVKGTGGGLLYRQGLLLLDLENPQRVLRRSNSWLFGPQTQDEIQGDVGNVTFSCGWILDEKTQQLHMYYGAADTVICLASAPMDEVMNYVRRMPEVGQDSSGNAKRSEPPGPDRFRE
jgi:predicted GH43/DUF377 family glycosyl hydrolase